MIDNTIDRSISTSLERQGYYVFKDIMEHDAIEQLRTYLNDQAPRGETGFYTSIWVKDKERRKRDYNVIVEAIWPSLERVFREYQPVMANFMIKKSSPDSSMGLHQDWTFTEEETYPSFNIWFPLQDITEESGPLKIIPYSHRINNPYRGKLIEQLFERGNDFLDKRYSKKLLLHKGDAVVFDTRMLHFSGQNVSGCDRVGASIVIASNKAQLVHFFKETREDNIARQIKVSKSYFYDFALDDIPLEIEPERVFQVGKQTVYKKIAANIKIVLLNWLNKRAN